MLYYNWANKEKIKSDYQFYSDMYKNDNGIRPNNLSIDDLVLWLNSNYYIINKEFIKCKNTIILKFKTINNCGTNYSTLRENGYYVIEGKEPYQCPNGKGATLEYMLNKWCEEDCDKVEVVDFKIIN